MSEINKHLTIKRSFNLGYKQLREIDQPAVKKRICNILGCEYNTGKGNSYFSLYRNGKKTMSPIERNGIEKVFKAFNIDPWTGAFLH